MKRIYLFLFLLFFVIACKTKDEKAAKSENNIDAARNFIRAALDGKFQEAKNYMLTDSVNLNYMDLVVERSYAKLDPETKNGYRSASINIHEVTEPVKDSVTIVIFSNSYKNDRDTLKVLKQNGLWLVDLKYLYEHSMDTVFQIIKKDSLP